MATLKGAMPTISLTTDDLRLLAYIQHMAETAHSDAARHMFQEYMQLEKRRLATSGTLGIQTRPTKPTPALSD